MTTESPIKLFEWSESFGSFLLQHSFIVVPEVEQPKVSSLKNRAKDIKLKYNYKFKWKDERY